MKINLINQTHWDREWYKSFEEFKFRLKDGIEDVQDIFEAKNIDKFFLDGQTVVLEDYKEVASKKRYENLLSLIKDKKIEVGPWYILADEFLITGESLVRNLHYGKEISKKVGSRGELGYLPDTFGHISQIPQILKKSNIDTALIFRGALSPTVKNIWIGADGTQINTFILPTREGYFQPELLSENYIENFKGLIEKNKEYFLNEDIFILNGADHIFPSKNLNEKIKTLKSKLGYEIAQINGSELIDYYKFSKNENKIYGEQRDNNKAYILIGVASTRSYLKRMNQEIEDKLLGLVEPFDVLTKGRFEIKNYIDYLWKNLIKNHAHDSICGCSIDEVHKEMEVRYTKLNQGISQLLETSLKKIVKFEPNLFNDKLHIINTDPQKRFKTVKTEILVPKNLDKGSITIFDKEKLLSFDILKRYEEERLIVQNDYLNYHNFVVYDVEIEIEFNGIENKVLILKIDDYNKRDTILKVPSECIENKAIRIKINSKGLLDIEDKITGKIYKNMNQYISTLDSGDEYNYSPPEIDKLSKAKLMDSECEIGKGYKKLKLKYELNQPEGLDIDMQSPSSIEVKSLILLNVTLRENQDEVYFKVSIDNKAKDQRLRVLFPLTKKIEFAYADSGFDIVKRKINRDLNYSKNIGEEMNPVEAVALSGVMAENILLTHRGLLEYSIEKIDEKIDGLYITLIRSVGHLSKRNLQTRRGGAGPGLKTPEAQCLRKEKYEYSVRFSNKPEDICNVSRAWRIEPIISQGVTEKIDLSNVWKKENDKIILSAMKLDEEKNMILRFVNSSENKEILKLEFEENIKDIKICNLLGETEKVVLVENKKIEIELTCKEILTLKILGVK
ncbi:glycoside hydrolase family 38 C-terminal domain-containing protein [Cetobacterium sp.]|uniref:glycoside hydrolase family 38 N-terminal domain-containing protein n=1 Tax=Cetobacterium sp. TaxID=2071632 RepID=UPI003EE5443C